MTIVTARRACLLSTIHEASVALTPFGDIVERSWLWLSEHYPYVETDLYVIMPNHLHGIVWLKEMHGSERVHSGLQAAATKADRVSAAAPRDAHKGIGGTTRSPSGLQAAATEIPKRKPLGQLIGAFKSRVTRAVIQDRLCTAADFWEYDYYEHVIRTEDDLRTIRGYIQTNPLSWEHDDENPNKK